MSADLAASHCSVDKTQQMIMHVGNSILNWKHFNMERNFNLHCKLRTLEKKDNVIVNALQTFRKSRINFLLNEVAAFSDYPSS